MEEVQFMMEWENVESLLRKECIEYLRSLGVTDRTIKYVGNFKKLLSFPYLVVLIIENAKEKNDILVSLSFDLVGSKLYDDFLDNDTPYDTWDLGQGVTMIHKAIDRLKKYPNFNKIFNVHYKYFEEIMVIQMKEARKPAQTFSEWISYASVKAGKLIEKYAYITCLAINQEHKIQDSCIFANRMGTLSMISDDLKDHHMLNEKEGNLGYLLKEKKVSFEDVRNFVEIYSQEAKNALNALNLNYAFVVDRFANDVINNLK